jgi:hypothetical protein
MRGVLNVYVNDSPVPYWVQRAGQEIGDPGHGVTESGLCEVAITMSDIPSVSF